MRFLSLSTLHSCKIGPPPRRRQPTTLHQMWATYPLQTATNSTCDYCGPQFVSIYFVTNHLEAMALPNGRDRNPLQHVDRHCYLATCPNIFASQFLSIAHPQGIHMSAHGYRNSSGMVQICGCRSEHLAALIRQPTSASAVSH